MAAIESKHDDAKRDEAKKMIEAYLGRLRRLLSGVNQQGAAEIIEELHSHILERVEASGDGTSSSVATILAALGSPDELANEYLTDNLLARAEASRSPLQILKSLFRWASLSVAGFFVLAISVLGYFLGAVFIMVAALKPFHPQAAGLWLLGNGAGDAEISLRLGFGGVPPEGRDLLGWWVVPVGLLAGCAVVVLTTRLALWCTRLYRRSRLLPRS
jgi:hypothetical protein